RDQLREAALGVLGEPRSDPGHAPGQRRRHAIPLGDLHVRPAASRRGRRVARGLSSAAPPGGPRRDHDGDPRSAGVLLRRGLSPAVPRQESGRLLRHRRHRGQLSDRARVTNPVYFARPPRYDPSMMRIALVAGALMACGGNKATPDAMPDAPLEGFTTPDIVCPGGPGCETTGDGVLKVGVAKRTWTPTNFETYTDEN